jgi:hypothetical protein
MEVGREARKGEVFDDNKPGPKIRIGQADQAITIEGHDRFGYDNPTLPPTPSMELLSFLAMAIS